MTWRYRLVLLFFIILFLLVISRLFYWQVVRASELVSLGQAQYKKQITLTAVRGDIKTSDDYPIVTNSLTYLVYANPKVVKDKKDMAEKLSSLLSMDSASISAKLNQNLFWVSLKSNIDNSVKEKIEKAKFPGVGFEDQTIRFYPEGSLAAKLLGFVGKDNGGEPKGYFGLEGYYDRQLKGKPGIDLVIRDASGKPIIANMSNASGKVDGRNILLHIDRIIQFILDRELKAGVASYGAHGGMAAIMDPKTGGILAMSAFPTYDPGNYGDFSDALYRDPFISDTYEPGSTFKPLIMASALDAGLVKPETTCTACDGPVSIGEYDIHTWDDTYFPNETMTEVIQHSDNTGMVFVGRLLGLDRLLSYFDKFGIGEMTGIDLQGEVVPQLRTKENWYPIDLATATFGQGIIVTPIELLDAFSSIANDGKRMEPHVVSAIETPEGEKITIPPKVLSQSISSKTAKVMTEILVNAVDNGEAKWAKPKGYRIAGKTGTAQIPVAGHYDPTKTIASFIGFAPAENPRFVMLVIIDRPTSSIYGAETAAPVFFKVAKDVLTYYNIPPSE
jgi:cell division protein FtsI/penicillin-binding protein 2